MKSIARPALSLFVALTVLCCVLYPLAMTAIGKLAFAERAAGSLVVRNGQNVGSELIGQAFSATGYFWGRPSATTPMPNNASSSGGSNLGPSNPALIDANKARIAALQAADPGNAAPLPVDLVTASASGLDPEISLAAAYYQAPRIARTRHLPLQQVRAMIEQRQAVRHFGFFGEPRVNVLALNLALDQMPAQVN
ncbi:MAG: potassium-transporting ATPase subunit KdpC [Burkholderiaceae bacterium]